MNKNSFAHVESILKEVIPNELEDLFEITDEEAVNVFIENLLIDIKDNL